MVTAAPLTAAVPTRAGAHEAAAEVTFASRRSLAATLEAAGRCGGVGPGARGPARAGGEPAADRRPRCRQLRPGVTPPGIPQTGPAPACPNRRPWPPPVFPARRHGARLFGSGRHRARRSAVLRRCRPHSGTAGRPCGCWLVRSGRGRRCAAEARRGRGPENAVDACVLPQPRSPGGEQAASPEADAPSASHAPLADVTRWPSAPAAAPVPGRRRSARSRCSTGSGGWPRGRTASCPGAPPSCAPSR
jgi:hypothetical protein